MGNNFGTRIFPYIEFAMISQELKKIHFPNDKIFQKNAKYPTFEPLLPKFGQKLIFHKNLATVSTKLEKTNEATLIKALN